MASRALLLLLLIALATPAVVGGARAPAASEAQTSLTIAYWADEQAQKRAGVRWTLRCSPVGGTLPTRRAACRRLAAMTSAAFAPVPRNAMCTQIYGGPQKAVVKGTLHGRPVWASFRRRNGCEIDRWQRFSPWLIPPASATS